MKKLCYLMSAMFLCAVAASCLNLDKAGETAAAHQPILNKGVNIEYTDSEKGDTTLLFVHGWGINHTYWDSQVAYFKSHYRVVTIDLPGFGQSGKNRSDWSTPAYGSDVAAVINQLQLKNVILIGHSMAGDIIVQAALYEPKQVIALIGVDNFKGAGVPNPDSLKVKASMDTAFNLMRHHFKAISSQYITQQLFSKSTDSIVRKRVLHDVLSGDSTIAVEAMAQGHFDEADGLAKAGKPLYLINSDVTPNDTTGLHNHHIPVHLMLVHGTGHYPMIEKPDEFNKLLALAIGDLHKEK